MRAYGVVVATPRGDLVACVAERTEPVQVEAFVAQLAVEALDEGILHRLAWFDEPQTYPGPLRPVEHRTARAFRAVVENYFRRQAKVHGQLVKIAGNAGAGDREVDDLPGTEPAVVVHDVEDPKPALVGQLIAHEVE